MTPVVDSPVKEAPANPIVPFTDLTARVAGEFAIEPAALWAALKTEFFPGGAASDAQMFLVLQIMDKYKLNPFMHEMFAAISQKTGKLLVGIQYDGFNTIAHRNPRYRGYQMEHERDPKTGKVIAVRCKVYRDDWQHPGEYYALMEEWFVQGKDTWTARPVHQLSIKAFNNCVKLTLGLTGLYDSDDIDRIQESENARPQAAIETTSTKIEIKQNLQSGAQLKGEGSSVSADAINTPAAPSALAKEEERESESRNGNSFVERSINAGAVHMPIHDELAKLIARTPPARLNLLLGQQGVARVEDLNDEQAAIVVARLSKGAK